METKHLPITQCSRCNLYMDSPEHEAVIKELEAEVAALRDKVADYEYPLRENNWVKVRQEVWDAKEAKAERLEKWQDIVRHYSRDAAMYADERMPISHWAELDP